jgi:hypothetical protein
MWIYLNAGVWTPLQRYYWNEYLNTEMFQGPRGDYSILETVDPVACSDDVGHLKGGPTHRLISLLERFTWLGLDTSIASSGLELLADVAGTSAGRQCCRRAWHDPAEP